MLNEYCCYKNYARARDQPWPVNEAAKIGGFAQAHAVPAALNEKMGGICDKLRPQQAAGKETLCTGVHSVLSETHIIGAGAIAAWNGNIQQAEKNAQLCPVVNDLGNGHADHLSLGGGAIDLISIAQGPGFGQVFFPGFL